MNDHIAGEDLAAYVDGALKGEPKAGLESHLSRCPECREALAEIVDVQGSAAEIPGEFLRLALKVPAEGPECSRRRSAPGEMPSPVTARPPMRLVFGIAAVFLVVVVIGYFFLSRDRFWETERLQKEKTAGLADRAVPRSLPEENKTIPVLVGGVDASADAEAKKQPAEKNAMSAPAPVQAPEKNSGYAAAVKDRRSAVVDEKEMRKVELKLEETLAQAAQPEMDKLGDGQVVHSLATETAAAVGGAQPALAAKAQAALPSGKGKAGAARYEEYQNGNEEPHRSWSAEPSFIDGGLGLFLAATGRAAAPLGIGSHPLIRRSPIRIEGDVSWADLRDPGLLVEWGWFKKGMVLELAIAADGAVSAVSLVGQQDRQAAVLAQDAARKLLFSASEKKLRRAVLTLSALPPN